MIFKLIVFGLLIYGVYRFFGGNFSLPTTASKDDERKPIDEETLLECSSCKTYVTKKDAIEYKGRYYCSKECLPN